MTDEQRHPESVEGSPHHEREILRSAPHDRRRGFPLAMFVTILAGYVLLMIIGYLVFRSDAAMVRGNEMSRDRAIFTVINAATLTGLQQTVATNEYLPAGKWMVLALMAGGSVFTLLAGGMGVARIAELPYSDSEIAVATASLVLLTAIGGACAFMIGGQPAFDALFLSVSSFGNCGLHVGAMPEIRDVRVHAVMLPLMVLGGVGVCVILDLRDRLLGRRASLSRFTQVVLTMTAAAYLIGLGAFFLAGNSSDVSQSLIAASAQSLNSRTGGFQFEFAHAFDRPMQWIYMLFMLVGGASGGTAGGIKVNTLFEICRGIRQSLKATPVSRSFGVAMVWLAIYFAMIFAGLLLMLSIVPQMPADRLLFLVISAIGNVGMSHDPVAIVKDGLYVLAILMILGKVAPLAILWWVARACRPGEQSMPVG